MAAVSAAFADSSSIMAAELDLSSLSFDRDSVSSATGVAVDKPLFGGTLNDKQLFDILQADKSANKVESPKPYDQRNDTQLKALHHGWLLQQVRHSFGLVPRGTFCFLTNHCAPSEQTHSLIKEGSLSPRSGSQTARTPAANQSVASAASGGSLSARAPATGNGQAVPFSPVRPEGSRTPRSNSRSRAGNAALRPVPPSPLPLPIRSPGYDANPPVVTRPQVSHREQHRRQQEVRMRSLNCDSAAYHGFQSRLEQHCAVANPVECATRSQFQESIGEVTFNTHASKQRKLLKKKVLRSAIQKLGEFTWCFRADPEDPKFKAFKQRFMTNTELRQQIKLSFDVDLTREETNVLSLYMDKNEDGGIDCVEFMREFWRFGRCQAEEERLNNLALSEKRTRTNQRVDQKITARYCPIQQARMAPHTPQDLNNVMYKLTHASTSLDFYDLTFKLGAFTDKPPMSPTVLKDQLMRNFQIKLSPAELAALVEHFDEDHNGTVSCVEFRAAFFRMGRNAKAGNRWSNWRTAHQCNGRRGQCTERFGPVPTFKQKPKKPKHQYD
jgi:Ca2+-binding EF-hand superfamily protein